MKKKLYSLLMIALFTVILVGCGNNANGPSTENSQNSEVESEKICEHSFTEATCKEPAFCIICGEVNGEALGHTLAEATCSTPATCEVCGEIVGETLAHSYSEATCTAPATCSVCGATDGKAKGHSYTGATCTTQGTCSVCGGKGSYGGHNYQNGTCTYCGKNSPANESVNLTASMDTALFIGDSRTEGIRLYTKEYTGTADFFSATSSSVKGIVNKNAKVDVAGVGKVSITELLDQRRYDKVYIMLGINEAGSGPSVIANNTKKLIDIIQQKQPGVVIFIMANFYVNPKYKNYGPSFSTANMKAINAAQGALANGQNIFYIDGNPLFVDANGDLSMEHSGDGCHLSKKACKTYAAWVIEQTKSLLGL